ncbi:DUF6261 family protein [uncultured Acetobacteroides sp.]|uniref:DUF6261 family protein n=1 Tax=uncultured Acetobacteroides sp. TaxID=1760811 RepID=UPI0029F589FA|nr:DUF6261 family protein [uncultured Acetobacteroides sp.]
MKKVKSFNLRKVLVDELGTFARNFCTIVKGLVASKQIPEPMVTGLEQGIKRYEMGVGPKVDKAGTERSRLLDLECDGLFLATKGAVRTAKFRPDQREAAQRMEDAIRNRGWNMQNAAYDAESNNIKLLLADIKGSPVLQADAVTIKCDDLLALLEAANKKFDASEADRKAKELELGGLNSYEAVKGLNAEIQRIFSYLDSVSGIYPEVAKAIDQINLLIDPLAAKIKTRETVAENKKKEEKEKEKDKPTQPKQ